MGKFVFRFVVLLVVCSMLVSFSRFNIVNASGNTIYIRAYGSIDPPTAPISSVDNVTYTFTDNIYDSIVVERDNIVLDGADYTLQGTRSENGIVLSSRSNVTVKNTNIRNFYNGIYLDYTSKVNIIGNNITNNLYSGIWLDHSFNNSIVGNRITNNLDGMVLYSASHNNRIVGNLFTNNGLLVWHSYGDVVEDNLVNGRPLVYLDGVSGVKIEDAGQVILVNCDSIHVENLNLSYTAIGIELLNTTNTKIVGNNITNNLYSGIWFYSYSYNNSIVGNNITNNLYSGIWFYSYSYNNSIAGNNITNNDALGIWLDYYSDNNSISRNNITTNSWYGIWLERSSHNSIVGNNIIANSWAGIYIDSSSDNKFYHNNLMGNTRQVDFLESGHVNVWDDSYLSGGNYWSDHTDVDLYSGPYQNLTGSDGIGDTQYTIDTDNRDRYPLMGMFSSFNNSLGYNMNVISNSTIEDFAYFQSNSTIIMHVSNMTANQTYGFCRLTIPHNLLPPPYNITINNNPIAYTTVFENETLTTIYFSYEHSTLEIIIIPEFPSALILQLFMVATILAVIVYRRKHFR